MFVYGYGKDTSMFPAAAKLHRPLCARVEISHQLMCPHFVFAFDAMVLELLVLKNAAYFRLARFMTYLER